MFSKKGCPFNGVERVNYMLDLFTLNEEIFVLITIFSIHFSLEAEVSSLFLESSGSDNLNYNKLYLDINTKCFLSPMESLFRSFSKINLALAKM